VIPAGTNYFINPSLETSREFDATRATLSLDTTTVYSGDQSLLITPTTVDESSIVHFRNGAVMEFTNYNAASNYGQPFLATMVAMSFIPTEDVLINSVQFNLTKVASPVDNLFASVWEESGSLTPGTLIDTSASVSGASLTGTPTWIMFSFDDPIELSGGQKYWVGFQRSGGTDGTNYYTYSTNNTNPLANQGRSLYNAGSWSAQSGTTEVVYIIGVAEDHPVAVAEDDEINASARVLSEQEDGEARIIIDFYTDDSLVSQVGSSNNGEWTTLSTNTYEEVKIIDLTVPATATVAVVSVEVNTMTGTLTSDRFRVDAISFRRNEALDTYIDGDQGSGYAWVGDAHYSISTRAEGAGEIYRRDYDAPQIIVSWEIWKSDVDGQKITDITHYVSQGFIEGKGDRAIVAQGQIELTDATVLDPLGDYVLLEMTVTIPPDIESTTYSMGLYEVGIPSVTAYWMNPEGIFALRDKSIIIGEAALTDSVTYEESDNIVDSAEILATDYGMDANFPSVSTTFPVDMSLPVGDGVLASVNKILEAANCYPAWMDFSSHKLVTLPIKDINLATSWGTYTPDMLLETPKLKVDNPIIPNVVLVIKSNSDEAPIVGEARNDSAVSPISTVSRGREISHVIKDSNVATLTEANALAAAKLQEMSSQQTSLDLVVLPTRPPSTHDTLTLTYHTDEGYCLCGKYWINSFRYDILGSSALKLAVSRTKEIAH